MAGRPRKKSAAGGKPTRQKAKTAGSRAGAGEEMNPYFSILLFGLGLLFVLLCFVRGASGWEWVRLNVFFGGFGVSAWLLGPLFIYWAVLVGLRKGVYGEIARGVLLLLALSGTVLVFGQLDFSNLDFAAQMGLLLESGKTRAGGGVLSLVFGWTLLKLVGRPAANFLVAVIIALVLMLFTGVTPADIARFFGRTAGRARDGIQNGQRRYAEHLEEYEQQELQKQSAPARRGLFRWRAPVDVPLGNTGPQSEPGLGENDEVEIGPGGTFGMNPLDVPLTREEEERRRAAVAAKGGGPLMPFDVSSGQSLLEPQSAEPEVLLFGEDDPYNNPSKLARGRYNVEVVPLPVNVNLPGEEIFALSPVPGQAAPKPAREDKAGGTAPARAAALASDTLPGEGALATNRAGEVDALIDRAAAAKPEDNAPAADKRGADETKPYPYPPLKLFAPSPPDDNSGAREEMKKTADLLVSTLASFGVQTRILDVCRGPSVTRYEIQPQTGVKVSKITSLADDIALNLATAGVRIEAPIPGKPAVGIEVPNRVKSVVSIRSILESGVFAGAASPLTIALGKDIAGDSVVTDLTKMPHLLIAGSTGSGKSVCVNSVIMSFLYRGGPEELRLMLIDPKVVELAEYNGIPHLLMPVVTEARKAAGALGQMVAEMERRYHLFAEYGVREIKSYNRLARREGMETIPYIAIIIDELADLMMVAGKEVEDYICRIAQKARAAGMHLIVATQRPSVDVITGLIKANIPSRIAFAVSSQVDSRTILDGGGAEKLLGMGDMLFMPVGANKPVRVQGTYVKDKEISAVLAYIKQRTKANYDDALIEALEKSMKAESEGGPEGGGDVFGDETFCAAVNMAIENGEISTSYLQRRMRLGYARAGRMVDQMEQMGIVGPPNGSKPRQVLINRQQWLEMSMNATG